MIELSLKNPTIKALLITIGVAMIITLTTQSGAIGIIIGAITFAYINLKKDIIDFRNEMVKEEPKEEEKGF